MTSVSVRSSGDVKIELAVQAPEEPRGTIVICHPHPSHGGTMRNPIIVRIAKEAFARSLTSVRFNFRGAGKSTGSHTGGPGEVDDLAAVMEHVASGLPPAVGIAGWSFGAAIALIWQSHTSSAISYAGIAPPVRRSRDLALPPPDSLVDADRELIIGDRDQFVTVEDLTRYAASIDARVNHYENTDHFFVNKHKRLAGDVVSALDT